MPPLTLPTETLWAGQGAPPIYDTTFLLDRIKRLDADDSAALAKAWTKENLGGFAPGLVDAARYRRIEALVQHYEPFSSPEAADTLSLLYDDWLALPEAVRQTCFEAMSVYAGMEDPTKWLLSSDGRLAEVARLVGQAQDWAATLPPEPTPEPELAPEPEPEPEPESIPAADPADTATPHPGVKADAKTIKLWVEGTGDPSEAVNRAGLAYVIEQSRSTPRKNVTTFLVALLGEDNLVKVRDAITEATPPPLDLGGHRALVPEQGAAGTASGQAQEPDLVSPLVGRSAPAAPLSPRKRELYLMLASAFTELAELELP